MFLLAELHGFLCGPRDQNVERNAWSSIPARNNIQSIQSLFENDGTKKSQSVYHHFLYYFWWLFRGSTTPLTVTYPLDSTVHGFSHVMIHVLPWSTGSVSFVLPLPWLRSECSMRQCLVRWIMVDDGRWCLDLVWNPGAECVSQPSGARFCAQAALAAAILFLAAEVKKYEIYDGITFQWFMCAGILMVGFLSAIIFGDFGMKDAENHLTVGSFERSGTGQIAL